MNTVKLKLTDLKRTEHHSVEHVKILKNILGTEHEKWPPLMVSTDMFILDGHHRFELAIELGFETISAYLVDYSDPDLEVRDYDTGEILDKEMLSLQYATGVLLPMKSTKHIFKNRAELKR